MKKKKLKAIGILAQKLCTTRQHAQSMIRKFAWLVDNAKAALAAPHVTYQIRVPASWTDHLCGSSSVSAMTSVATATTANGDAKKAKPNLPIDRQVNQTTHHSKFHCHGLLKSSN